MGSRRYTYITDDTDWWEVGRYTYITDNTDWWEVGRYTYIIDDTDWWEVEGTPTSQTTQIGGK